MILFSAIFVAFFFPLSLISFCGMAQMESDAQPDAAFMFAVTLENVNDSQPLSPGVFVVHNDNLSLDFMGELAHGALEPLAEYGSHADFAEYVQGLDGVVEVYAIDAPVLPGENTSFIIEVNSSKPLYLSGVQMAVGCNDGYALLDGVEIVDMNLTARSSVTEALNYDAGTEENQPLGSGFSGGQPDPSRGEENIENGIPTKEPVSPHPQLTEPILTVSIVA